MKRGWIALSLAVTAATLGFACGDSSSTDSPDASAGDGGNRSDGKAGADGSAAADGAVASPCPAILVSQSFGDLVASIASTMKSSGGPDSGAMMIPSDTDRDAFAQQALVALTFDGTKACPLPTSYRVFALTDGGDDVRIVAELDATGAPAPSLYWGTYAARRSHAGTRSLVIEAPHPLADTNTESQSAAIFSNARAEWFLLAGTHRCANGGTSGCDGTTDACGATAPFREADTAHSTKAPFWAVHVALSNSTTSPFLQIHGNGETCPDALVSDGSGTYTDAGIAAQLANAIESRGPTVGRCGLGYPTAKCDLCALDNVEGRATAGSSAACTMVGSTYGRFIHIEQQFALRETSGEQPVLDAVNATFPAR